jgi:protein TonB
MFELNRFVPKTHRLLPVAPPVRNPEERKQRRLMVIALALLVVALGFVLFRDRDFWFPDTEQAEDLPLPAPQAQPTVQAASTSATSSIVTQPEATAAKKRYSSKSQPKTIVTAKSVVDSPSARPDASTQTEAPDADDSSAPPLTATTTRTVLPPLEVEVVAGDVHKTVRPGTNSVRVDLQPGSPAQEVTVPPAARSATDSTARVTSNAAEHVQMSSGTAEVVSRPVKPDYPLLARQMKVQGSVILQALIGRDGLIQDLHVLSGPPILASAAQEAVKQWHFKPHYQGAETVETQARITVNFTISTN